MPVRRVLAGFSGVDGRVGAGAITDAGELDKRSSSFAVSGARCDVPTMSLSCLTHVSLSFVVMSSARKLTCY
jgi:hypothetical protein